MVEEIVPLKNIDKFKDKLWCKLYVEGKLKDFIQDYYIDKNNTWHDTMNTLQITHRRLSKCITYYNLKKPKDKVIERVQKSLDNRYGCKSYFECKDFEQKRKETMINKYGVEYTLQSNELTDKVYQTTKKRYGYENPFLDIQWQRDYGGSSQSWNENARNVRKQKSMNRYNTEFPTQRNCNIESVKIINDKQKFIDFIKSLNEEDRTIINIATKLNLSYDVVNAHYKQYNLWNIVPLRQFRSMPEIEITEYIKTIYNKPIITNIRTIITPYELDIYLPDIQFAIEFDGDFWHDKKNQIREKKKDKLCNAKDITLIHIWEDDWNTNKQKELSKIKYYIEGRVG